MIVGDFNVKCVTVTPYETNSVLSADPDAVLSCTAAPERFQPVAGKESDICKRMRGMDLDEFSLDDLNNPMEASGISSVKNKLGIFGSKRSNHDSQYMTLYVLRQVQIETDAEIAGGEGRGGHRRADRNGR